MSLMNNIELLTPYINRRVNLGESLDSCLGCDYRVPTQANGLCVDCETPGLALDTYRQAKEKIKEK